MAVGLGDRAIRALADVVADVPVPDSGATCQLVVGPDTAERIRDDLVRATRIDALRGEGRLRLAVADGADGHAFLSTPGTAIGLVDGTVGGQIKRPSPIVDDDPDPAVREIADTWAAGARPADRGPGRGELIEAAGAALSPGFAADVEAALAAADRLPRIDTGNPTKPDARSLLVAAGARGAHLLRGVRTFAGEQGIVHSESFAGVKRRLVRVGLVETVEIPRGAGRPPIRLRPADTALADCPPADLPALLRERLADLGSDPGSGAESASRFGSGPDPERGVVDHPDDFDRRAGRDRPGRDRLDHD